MSRSNLPKDTARALAPVLVPLLTKVALPLAIESLRRGRKFDTESFVEDAKESLGKELFFRKNPAVNHRSSPVQLPPLYQTPDCGLMNTNAESP